MGFRRHAQWIRVKTRGAAVRALCARVNRLASELRNLVEGARPCLRSRLRSRPCSSPWSRLWPSLWAGLRSSLRSLSPVHRRRRREPLRFEPSVYAASLYRRSEPLPGAIRTPTHQHRHASACTLSRRSSPPHSRNLESNSQRDFSAISAETNCRDVWRYARVDERTLSRRSYLKYLG